LAELLRSVLAVESLFGWAADVEWTGTNEDLTILQARPITSADSVDTDEKRRWYLSLRPDARRLKELALRVSEELIPRLEQEGADLAAEDLSSMSDSELSAAIRRRLDTVHRWKEIYVEEFIPLAHGVRQLAIYYNEAVKPNDPYEFMGLLSTSDLIAARRNQRIALMSEMVQSDADLHEVLQDYHVRSRQDSRITWDETAPQLEKSEIGRSFLKELDSLLAAEADIAYKGERLATRPELVLHTILELANNEQSRADGSLADPTNPDLLEQKLLSAVGREREAEALDVIRLGRLSWKLRDDDNLLVGRIESQLIRSLEIAAHRLNERGLISEYERLSDRISLVLAEALIYPPDDAIELIDTEKVDKEADQDYSVKARQLVGQPAGSGIASGKARIVANASDLLEFKSGEVLVCDAIQPTMTHIVPLACAIVERRGGMLIHGAIIAREMGVPCVNGVADATRQVKNGELITVDGYLGIVTIGPPELLLETAVDKIDSMD
jgi:pyruvate,water dikinase